MRARERRLSFFLILVLGLQMMGCGSAGNAPGEQNSTAPAGGTTPGTIKVAVSPVTTGVIAGTSTQFTATVSGTPNTAVNWSASTGTISSNGLYSAPNVTTATTVTISATSVADSTQSASATVVVNIPTPSTATYDQYGGVIAKPSPNGATGAWRVEKFGNHWIFVTPAGHAMWMKGVFDVAVDSHTDDLGSDYKSRIMNKYGSLANWAFYTNKRLKAWSFNTLAEYSMSYNISSAEKMPYVYFVRPAHYGLLPNSFTSSPAKDLIPGANSNYKGYRGGTVPDVFDPSFSVYVNGSLSGTAPTTPWLIGIAVDDSDSLYGFGPGPDISTGHTSVHIGWLTLVTNPTQTSNASLNVTSYTDPKVYTKQALADSLQTKYGTIAALNAAWGSNYTSFGSAGGFGVGSGLLDEDGRNSWVGTDSAALSDSAAAVKTDLDAFLYQYAKQYFSVTTAAVRKYAPGTLVMGPATLNGWSGVSRQQVLTAAGQYLDIVQASVATQQALDLTAQATGGKPLITWQGAIANVDSCLWRYPGGVSSQSLRAGWYQSSITQDFNSTVTGTGLQPVVGMKFWAFTDSWAEKADWGLVSLSDNAYDGVEASVGGTVDAYGFPRGGEEKDYGDFIGVVKSTNNNIDHLVSLLP